MWRRYLSALPGILTALVVAGALASPARAVDFAHGRVSAVDGKLLVRGTEDADFSYIERNAVVREGDTVWTDERSAAELELADENWLRLGEDTKIEIQRLEPDPQVRVWTGSLYADISRRLTEGLLIQTPGGDVDVEPESVVRLDVRENGVATVSVYRGRARIFSETGDRLTLDEGRRIHLEPGSRPGRDVSFDRDELRDPLDRFHLDRIDYYRKRPLPDAIREPIVGARDLHDNGDWVIVDRVQYWKPRCDPDWRPYSSGYWSYLSGAGYTWIDTNPWFYATSHYGRWQYRPTYGWLWCPGYRWSPAWVHWGYTNGYVAWAPLDPWDRPCYINRSAFVFNFVFDSRTWSVCDRDWFDRRHRFRRHNDPVYVRNPIRRFDSDRNLRFADFRPTRDLHRDVKPREAVRGWHRLAENTPEARERTGHLERRIGTRPVSFRNDTQIVKRDREQRQNDPTFRQRLEQRPVNNRFAFDRGEHNRPRNRAERPAGRDVIAPNPETRPGRNNDDDPRTRPGRDGNNNAGRPDRNEDPRPRPGRDAGNGNPGGNDPDRTRPDRTPGNGNGGNGNPDRTRPGREPNDDPRPRPGREPGSANPGGNNPDRARPDRNPGEDRDRQERDRQERDRQTQERDRHERDRQARDAQERDRQARDQQAERQRQEQQLRDNERQRQERDRAERDRQEQQRQLRDQQERQERDRQERDRQERDRQQRDQQERQQREAERQQREADRQRQEQQERQRQDQQRENERQQERQRQERDERDRRDREDRDRRDREDRNRRSDTGSNPRTNASGGPDHYIYRYGSRNPGGDRPSVSGGESPRSPERSNTYDRGGSYDRSRSYTAPAPAYGGGGYSRQDPRPSYSAPSGSPSGGRSYERSGGSPSYDGGGRSYSGGGSSGGGGRSYGGGGSGGGGRSGGGGGGRNSDGGSGRSSGGSGGGGYSRPGRTR